MRSITQSGRQPGNEAIASYIGTRVKSEEAAASMLGTPMTKSTYM